MIDASFLVPRAPPAPDSDPLMRCSVGPECARLFEQHVAHLRLVWLYLPLGAMVLLLGGFVLFGRWLGTLDRQRRLALKPLQRLLIYSGVVAAAATTLWPLVTLSHLLWAVDVVLAASLLLLIGASVVISRRSPPR